MAQSTPNIPLQQVQSSQIEAIGYQDGTLAVKFIRTKGIVYHYPNFPADKWAGFQAAESKGRFFKDVVRPMYPTGFTKVPEAASAAA